MPVLHRLFRSLVDSLREGLLKREGESESAANAHASYARFRDFDIQVTAPSHDMKENVGF